MWCVHRNMSWLSWLIRVIVVCLHIVMCVLVGVGGGIGIGGWWYAHMGRCWVVMWLWGLPGCALMAVAAVIIVGAVVVVIVIVEVCAWLH